MIVSSYNSPLYINESGEILTEASAGKIARLVGTGAVLAGLTLGGVKGANAIKNHKQDILDNKPAVVETIKNDTNDTNYDKSRRKELTIEKIRHNDVMDSIDKYGEGNKDALKAEENEHYNNIINQIQAKFMYNKKLEALEKEDKRHKDEISSIYQISDKTRRDLAMRMENEYHNNMIESINFNFKVIENKNCNYNID